MNLFQKLAAAAIVCGVALGVQATASAHGPGGGYGHYQVKTYGGQGALRYSGGYAPSYRPTWHDTTHFDYHPGSIQRHGNHFHVVPGHYDLHRSGHFHW